MAPALGQISRIIGPSLRERLGLAVDAPFPDDLDPIMREHVVDITTAHAGRLAEELAIEASASDDVQDADSAAAYLEDRLRFFGPLLSDSTRQQIRAGFHSAHRPWVRLSGQ